MSENGLPKYLRSATGQAVEIESGTVVNLCPTEAEAFVDTLHHYGMGELDFAYWYDPDADLDTLAKKLPGMANFVLPKKPTAKRPRSMAVRGDAGGAGNAPTSEHDQLREAAEHILAAWERLSKAFRDATTVGGSYLTPRVGVPGVVYNRALDETDDPGWVLFAVDGAYQLSPAGTAFREKLSLAPDIELDTHPLSGSG
jgi:hypothetical protein